MVKNDPSEYVHFYLFSAYRLVGIIFAGFGFIGTAIVFISFMNSDLYLARLSFQEEAMMQGTSVVFYLPYLLPGLIFSLFFLIGAIIVALHYRKRRKILDMIRDTRPMKAVVISNVQNFHVRMNKIPRREVQFRTADGRTLLYRFFSERLASFLKENTEADILEHKGRAYPAPSFFDKIMDSKEVNTSSAVDQSKEESFNSFVESAKNFEKSGDITSTISFYEGALSFKKDRIVAKKLLILYERNNETRKAQKLKTEMRAWS